MRKVIGIGETILDIIFRGDQPSAAVPGGSVFNGMMGIPIPIMYLFEAKDGKKQVVDGRQRINTILSFRSLFLYWQLKTLSNKKVLIRFLKHRLTVLC